MKNNKGVRNMEKLVLPKKDNPKKLIWSCRFSQEEYNDLRKCAISKNITMTDLIKSLISDCKKDLQEKGEWKESLQRE